MANFTNTSLPYGDIPLVEVGRIVLYVPGLWAYYSARVHFDDWGFGQVCLKPVLICPLVHFHSMSIQLSTWNAHSIQGNCGNSARRSEIILQENKGPRWSWPWVPCFLNPEESRAQAIHLYEIVFSTNLQVWTWLVPFWFTPLTWEHKFMYYSMFVITVLYVACVTKYGVSNGSEWIVKSNCEIKI